MPSAITPAKCTCPVVVAQTAGWTKIGNMTSSVSRAATWDDVDADLEMIQRDATFRALDGPLRVLERVRGNLAELRHVQGESAPRLPDGFYARKIAESTDPPAKPQLHLTGADVSKPTPTNKPLDNMTREELKAHAIKIGYEGDDCQLCGNFTMIRNATCLLCVTCGSTTGCS